MSKVLKLFELIIRLFKVLCIPSSPISIMLCPIEKTSKSMTSNLASAGASKLSRNPYFLRVFLFSRHFLWVIETFRVIQEWITNAAKPFLSLVYLTPGSYLGWTLCPSHQSQDVLIEFFDWLTDLLSIENDHSIIIASPCRKLAQANKYW